MVAIPERNPGWRAGVSGGAGVGRLPTDHNSPAALVQPNLEETARFLRLLDPTAESLHFRTYADKGGAGGGRNYHGTLEFLKTQLQLDNGKGRGVCVVVNEGGQKDDDITRVRAVFADFDDGDKPLPPLPLAPHAIIESSPGKYHVYWLTDGLPVEEFEPLQRRIVAALGSDSSVCNKSRVMRLPGFVHHKAEPFLSRIIHESSEPAYAPERVLEAFPVREATPLRQTPAAGAAERTGTRAGTGARVVDVERHGDMLKMAARLARSVHFDGVAEASALALLHAEAERGRWTRDMPADELDRAFYGALDKCRSGEWRQADKADVEDVEDAEPRLVEVDVTDVMSAHVEPPSFVITPLIPRSHVTLLGGHGGAGKSMLALTWAAHVVCGQPWGRFAGEQCNAVFVSLEDPGELVRFRLRRIIETYGLDAGAVAAGLRILDGTDASAALMTEVSEFGARRLVATPTMLEIEQTVAGAGLVVVDNASDAFDGDENNRRQVRTFIRRLAGIAKGNGGGVVLLAHIDKHAARYASNGNTYSGSTAWHNSARSRLALVTDENGGIELLHEKCNLAKLADPVRLAWSDLGVLTPVAVDAGGAPAGESLVAAIDADAVLGVVEMAVAAGITVPTATSGPATAWHALQPLPELGQAYRQKDGKRRVHAALIRLGREGRLVRGLFRTAYRNDRECWQLPQTTAGGEKNTTKTAADISPITPSALPQRLGACGSAASALTPATPATPAAAYRRATEGG